MSSLPISALVPHMISLSAPSQTLIQTSFRSYDSKTTFWGDFCLYHPKEQAASGTCSLQGQALISPAPEKQKQKTSFLSPILFFFFFHDTSWSTGQSDSQVPDLKTTEETIRIPSFVRDTIADLPPLKEKWHASYKEKKRNNTVEFSHITT